MNHKLAEFRDEVEVLVGHCLEEVAPPHVVDAVGASGPAGPWIQIGGHDIRPRGLGEDAHNTGAAPETEDAQAGLCGARGRDTVRQPLEASQAEAIRQASNKGSRKKKFAEMRRIFGQHQGGLERA